MYDRCSSFLDYPSFTLFTQFKIPLKPYSTTLRPIISIHSNLVIISRRSRRRRRLHHCSPLLAAQSSTDIDLIDTKEHHDGSLLFRFGDASEVAKNDELMEKLESKTKQESNVLKVLDGDQEREVIVKTIEREDETGDERLTEVADSTKNLGIDGNVIERETTVTGELSDAPAESSVILSDISQGEEVFSLESDDKMSNSLHGVDSNLDISESTAQHDEDESSNPVTTSVADDSLCGDKSLDSKEALAEDNSGETRDQLIYVKVEPSMENSCLEVTEIIDPDADGELDKVETEDSSKHDTKDLTVPTIMQISNIEVMNPTNKDVEEDLQDANVDECFPTDVMPPSHPLVAEPILEDVNQLQSVPANLEQTTQISVIATDQDDMLPQVNINNSSESNIVDVTSVASVLEAEATVNEEENQLQSVSVNLMETMQVSDIEAKETTEQKLDNDSHTRITDATIQEVEEGLQDVNMEDNSLIDVMPLSSPSETEPTFDEVNQLQPVSDKLEPIVQFSTIGDIDAEDQPSEGLQQVNIDNRDGYDIMNVKPVSSVIEDEPVINEGVSQLQADPVELKATRQQVSDNEVKDTMNLDDAMLQVTNEDSSDYIKDLMMSSEAHLVEDKGVSHNKLEQFAEADASENRVMPKQDECDKLLEAEGTVDNASSGLAELSDGRAVLLATKAKAESREEISLVDYFLSSGAALLEHPSEALTGGVEAYFVAGTNWLGVASGVGRWSLGGTDRGVFAQELMKTCEKTVFNSSSVSISNPVELLCRGVRETHSAGSSTVMLANFDDQVLHVANIGDTGFIIIRHGGIYKKSSPMLHEFNFPFQIEQVDDPLQLVEEYQIELDEGDVVVSATDGLFDNLYEKEIAMIVSKSLQAGMKPEKIAQVLAERAQKVGRSAFVRSPFADAAQAAGYTGYAGGKLDGVAVIVSLVEKRSKLSVK